MVLGTWPNARYLYRMYVLQAGARALGVICDDRDCVRGGPRGGALAAAAVPGLWISCGAIGWQFLAVRTRGGRGSISLGRASAHATRHRT